MIPTFRRARMLRRAVASCIGQERSGASCEIVVVDNCADGSAAETIRHSAARAAVPVRYVHEPRPGVSHARNAGVARARGRFVAFLDDDETAGRDWLAALLAVQAATGADVVHGAVVASLPDDGIDHAEVVQSFFTRRVAPGCGGRWRRSGIGNCLLVKATCFSDPAPFDPELGRIGGEDSLFLQKLASRGLRFAAAPDAIAYEHVPHSRATLGYILRRKFRTSQIHTLLATKADPRSPVAVARWMTIGAAQVAAFGPIAVLAWAARSPRWPRWALKASAGLGKLFWMQALIRREYGHDAALPAIGRRTSAASAGTGV